MQAFDIAQASAVRSPCGSPCGSPDGCVDTVMGVFLENERYAYRSCSRDILLACSLISILKRSSIQPFEALRRCKTACWLPFCSFERLLQPF